MMPKLLKIKKNILYNFDLGASILITDGTGLPSKNCSPLVYCTVAERMRVRGVDGFEQELADGRGTPELYTVLYCALCTGGGIVCQLHGGGGGNAQFGESAGLCRDFLTLYMGGGRYSIDTA